MKFRRIAAVFIFMLGCFSLYAIEIPQSPEAYEALCQQELEAIQTGFENVKSIEGNITMDSFFVPFHELLIQIDHSLNRNSIYPNVYPDSAVRSISEKYEQEIEKITTQISLSREIYNNLTALDLSKESADTRFYIDKLIKEFERSGLNKDEATRKKIADLQDELLKLGQDFERNIRDDVRFTEVKPEDMKGLPEDYIESHPAEENGLIRITTDYPDYIPFMEYAESQDARKAMSIVFRQRGYPANDPVLKAMIAKRSELAALLDYPTWAAYETSDKMAANPETVSDFIERLSDVTVKQSNAEKQALLERIRLDHPEADKVERWNWAYYEEKLKSEKYDLDTQKLRRYFQYDKVRDGLFDVTGKLFGVTYKKADVPVWDPSVEAYEIWSGDQKIGLFYLDMHPRANKFKHAMMTEIVTGVEGVQLPVGALVCNFPGGDGTPGFMQHDDVATFFHEFGHLTHFLLGGHQRWIGISGISMEWDFVEMPSTLLEEWAWEPGILKLFAVNPEGETIPDELISQLLKTRTFDLAMGTRQQLFYTAVSLEFFNQPAPGFEPLDMVKTLQTEYSPMEYVDGTYMHLNFGHLVDYGSTYYTYLWSEVIAKDIFGEFKKAGLMNKKVAQKYRKAILDKGGSEKAADMVRDFLGRDYSVKAYESYLAGS